MNELIKTSWASVTDTQHPYIWVYEHQGSSIEKKLPHHRGNIIRLHRPGTPFYRHDREHLAKEQMRDITTALHVYQRVREHLFGNTFGGTCLVIYTTVE